MYTARGRQIEELETQMDKLRTEHATQVTFKKRVGYPKSTIRPILGQFWDLESKFEIQIVDSDC